MSELWDYAEELDQSQQLGDFGFSSEKGITNLGAVPMGVRPNELVSIRWMLIDKKAKKAKKKSVAMEVELTVPYKDRWKVITSLIEDSWKAVEEKYGYAYVCAYCGRHYREEGNLITHIERAIEYKEATHPFALYHADLRRKNETY